MNDKEEDVLPPGWTKVVLQEKNKSHLLSPPFDQSGQPQKQIKVFSRTLAEVQGPSKKYPDGRFHEINDSHFISLNSITSKRADIEVACVKVKPTHEPQSMQVMKKRKSSDVILVSNYDKLF